MQTSYIHETLTQLMLQALILRTETWEEFWSDIPKSG